MATQITPVDTYAAPVVSRSFERFASICALVAGVVGFLYALSNEPAHLHPCPAQRLPGQPGLVSLAGLRALEEAK